MLRVNDVRVTIKGFIILRGVSLNIPSGGLIGLVGRNGAGKTTTLKSIMGLVPVSAGAISFDGQDLAKVPGYRRAHLGFGYMPEDRRLIGALTVQDNILTPAWASGLESANERLDYIYQMMPDIQTWASRRATQLSGGQQKMVALARAIMSGTKLLLLDEPFEGLAPLIGGKLGKTIQDIQGEGLSVLIAESDDRRISFVGEIYTIERGEVVQTGDTKAGEH
ncbi:MAG: ATP-binding cassette domain-containing protein [Thermodesulfobacteriota bacterium]|nr:ATP-binding cassette domain-containing protein [Thermodesulfobacteriota bacterium]